VEAAARTYFGKTAADLTVSQAALLAALAKAPGTLRPHGRRHERLLARQQWVLGRLAHLGLISAQELEAAREAPLAFRHQGGRSPVFPFEAPHFVELVLARPESRKPSSGLLATTLDLSLQQRTEAILRSHRTRLAKCGASQAAGVVVDNRTLMVLALAGSYKYGPRDQGFNNGAAALRSPGSTLKPFLYAQALDVGFTSATVLEDVERRYRTPRGEFNPANFDRSAHGPVSLREALGNSLNLSSVHLLNHVGPESLYDTLRTLGLINHPERGAGHYGLGLVVGNPEVSLLQLAAAYACLANGGLFRPLRFLAEEPLESGVPVFSAQAAYLVCDILSDPLARGRIFGGSLAMNQPYRLAVKTGTSTRYRDCWAVACSPEYTVAVWVGNFGGRPTANLSGAAAAAPIVADLARELFGEGASADWPRPEGVAETEVCAFSGLLPRDGCAHVRRELFLAGTEPGRFCSFHQGRDPWHRLATPYAGWLHQRYAQGGEGRYRLAGFDQDLGRLFPDGDREAGAGPGQGRLLTQAPQGGESRRRPFPSPEAGPVVTIIYPLRGDRFLLEPASQVLRLTVKASCRAPLPEVTWFVDGCEAAVTGPPYEAPLELARGRHRLLAVGPDGRGDEVVVAVE
jgi:penicillin-binding protein 1C